MNEMKVLKQTEPEVVVMISNSPLISSKNDIIEMENIYDDDFENIEKEFSNEMQSIMTNHIELDYISDKENANKVEEVQILSDFLETENKFIEHKIDCFELEDQYVPMKNNNSKHENHKISETFKEKLNLDKKIDIAKDVIKYNLETNDKISRELKSDSHSECSRIIKSDFSDFQSECETVQTKSESINNLAKTVRLKDATSRRVDRILELLKVDDIQEKEPDFQSQNNHNTSQQSITI